MGWLSVGCLTTGVLLAAGLLLAAWQSRRENEPVAARRFLFAAVLLPVPWFAAAWVTPLAVGLVGATVIGAVVLVWPHGNPRPADEPRASGRLDERDTMFSRAELRPGTDRFEQYYARRPEHLAPDTRCRKRPGLLQPGSAYHDPVHFAAAEASFTTVAALHPLVDRTPARSAVPLAPAAATRFLKGWARKLGARDCGVTALRPEHVYHTGGRGDRYDEPLEVDHRWAVAVTVEMAREMLEHGPAGPVVMESAQQYLASGAVAIQLAELIRRLGYRARAHIDGNYLVCCPLVARDANLGEIGRLGLLMTPELGPRVRIAVVTTDLPLVADERPGDPSVGDFCRLCAKCADCCPAGAVPRGDFREVQGTARWQVDQAACFTFWAEAGTDCGRCVRVCPYAHADTWLHRPVRRALGRSRAVRRLALWLDDLFYGRRPAPRPVHGWLDTRDG